MGSSLLNVPSFGDGIHRTFSLTGTIQRRAQPVGLKNVTNCTIERIIK